MENEDHPSPQFQLARGFIIDFGERENERNFESLVVVALER